MSYHIMCLWRIWQNKNSHVQLVGFSTAMLEGNLAAFRKMKNVHTL